MPRRPFLIRALVSTLALSLTAACADSPPGNEADAAATPRRDAANVAEDRGALPDDDARSSADARPPADARETADAGATNDANQSDHGGLGGASDTGATPDGPLESDGMPGSDAAASPDAAPPPPDPCAAAVDLNAAVAGVGHADGDTRGAPAQTLGTCGGAAGGEVYFTWIVGPDLAPVTFATDFPETTAATVLYVRDACGGPRDLGCTRGSPAEPGARLRFVPPAPGVYYVVVDTGSPDGGGPFRLTASAEPRPACDDARDNDGDGRTDAADPGCADGLDESEADPPAPALCSDGLDNDEDGVVDYPADPDCVAAGDDGERGDQCGDEPVCGGANTGPGFMDNSSTGGPWIAFRYRPLEDRTIFRLEVFTGEIVGVNTLSLYTSDPATDGPGVPLAAATWNQGPVNEFQGAELDTPTDVVAGLDYWVVWQPVGGSQSPFDNGGDPVDYRGSPDQGRSWNGPFQAACKFRVICCRP